MAAHRFRLTHKVTGLSAEVSGPPLECLGDQALCRDLQARMTGPAVALTQSREGGERGTRLTRLTPDSSAWFLTQLRQAAADLDLQLEPAPLQSG